MIPQSDALEELCEKFCDGRIGIADLLENDFLKVVYDHGREEGFKDGRRVNDNEVEGTLTDW